MITSRWPNSLAPVISRHHGKAQAYPYPVPDLEPRNRNDPSRLAGSAQEHRWQITSAKAGAACSAYSAHRQVGGTSLDSDRALILFVTPRC